MFGITSNANSNIPISEADPSNDNYAHIDHHQNRNYTCLNNIPSQLLDDDEFFLSTILPYQSQLSAPPLQPQPLPERVVADDSGKEGEHIEVEVEKPLEKGKRKRDNGEQTKPKKRAGKRDRHSKIYTAQGPRDRRMRLSLHIARKFFDLQDMLGFDKASKTIEWLFNKSKAAIKDLAERSCTSTRVPSPTEEANVSINNEKRKKKMGNNQGESLSKVKENRENARKRARERTMEKLMMMQKDKEVHYLEIEKNPSCGIVRASNDQTFTYGFNALHGQQPLEEQMASVGMIEKFLATTSSNSTLYPTSMTYNNLMMEVNGVGFGDLQGNWIPDNAMICGGNNEVSTNRPAGSVFENRPYN